METKGLTEAQLDALNRTLFGANYAGTLQVIQLAEGSLDPTEDELVKCVEDALEAYPWNDANGEDLRSAAQLVVRRLMISGYLP